MEEAARDVRTSIDHPQEDERITTSNYAFKIKAPLNAERVDVSVDGASWTRCRYASGFWWHDWTQYQSGNHEIAARIRPFDSRGYILRKRRFSVELECLGEPLARHTMTQYSVMAPNAPGSLARLLAALAQQGIAPSCLMCVNVGDSAAFQFIAAGDGIVEKLGRAGFKARAREVFSLELGKHPSHLNRLAKSLAQRDINVLSLFGTAGGGKMRMILAVDQPRNAAPIVSRLAG